MAISTNIYQTHPADALRHSVQMASSVGQMRGQFIRATDGVITKFDEVRMEDLNSDAFKASVETLVNLWVTRFGNEWVEIDRIEDDKFFFAAYKRLRSLGMLETHYLTDRSRFVCRKPE